MPRVTKVMLEIQIEALEDDLEGHRDMLKDTYQQLLERCNEINELRAELQHKTQRVEQLTKQVCGFEQKFKQHIYNLYHGEKSSFISFTD